MLAANKSKPAIVPISPRESKPAIVPTLPDKSSPPHPSAPSHSPQQSAPPRQAAQAPPLSRRFVVAVGLLVVLSMSVFWLINSAWMQHVMRQQATELGQTMAGQLASQVAELLLANDLISLNVVLNNVVQNTNIAAVAVLDVDGELIAAAAGQPAPPFSLLPFQLTEARGDYRVPIRLADATDGYVQLSLDLRYIEANLGNTLVLVVAAMLVLLLVAVHVTLRYFQYLVRFPLQTLNFALSRIRHGEIDRCPEPDQDNELTATIRQFNATAEFLANSTLYGALQRRRAEAGGLTPDLFDQEVVTLLGIRLANYQYLSSTLPGEQLAQILNNYYFLTSRVVHLYGGRVIQCVDGALLIAFNDNEDKEEQAFHAVCAGQLLLRMIAASVGAGAAAELAPPGQPGAMTDATGDEPGATDGETGAVGGASGATGKLGAAAEARQSVKAKYQLAVHSGSALSGLYSPITGQGDNFAGDTVDAAWHLCDQCPDNRLLISQDAFDRAGGEARIAADALAGEVSGWNQEVTPVSYLVQEPMANYKTLLDKQAEQLSTLWRQV